MNTTARLEQLKRDLAQVETRRSQSGSESDRGREADHPGEIPPKGWMDVLWRAWGEVSDQNLFLIAGGVTYAILLALFPGLAALGFALRAGVRCLADREAGGRSLGRPAGADAGTAEPSSCTIWSRPRAARSASAPSSGLCWRSGAPRAA